LIERARDELAAAESATKQGDKTMAATAATRIQNLSDAEHSAQLRRAVVASTVGTVIEAYDFLLYVLVAPLVFAKLFFPSSDPLVGTLQAFGIYAVGFVARPVGAAFFGHYGDRIGRKVTLIATLLLTGLSTFAVGFVPSYASIGIWGAVILTAVRFIQGIGIGGEWGGATLIAMEWAKTNKHRGFITSWPQWGAPAGLFVANVMVLAFSAISGDQFLNWGWRVPFWISIVMVAIGMWIRLGILETPVFQRILDRQEIARAPVFEVLRKQPREIVLTALCRMAEQGPFYIFVAFIFTYGTTILHSSRDMLLFGVLCATAVSTITLPVAGAVSDRIGRKKMYLIGAATMGVWGFAYFALLNTMVPGWIFLAIVVSLIPHDMMYGPQGALIAECFSPRLRYSGASLGYHLSSVIAGGPAPLIATALLASTGSGYPVAIYIAACALVSITSTAFLPDYTNRDISQEDAYGADTAAAQPLRAEA
jgi:MFS family permease